MNYKTLNILLLSILTCSTSTLQCRPPDEKTLEWRKKEEHKKQPNRPDTTTYKHWNAQTTHKGINDSVQNTINLLEKLSPKQKFDFLYETVTIQPGITGTNFMKLFYDVSNQSRRYNYQEICEACLKDLLDTQIFQLFSSPDSTGMIPLPLLSLRNKGAFCSAILRYIDNVPKNEIPDLKFAILIRRFAIPQTSDTPRKHGSLLNLATQKQQFSIIEAALQNLDFDAICALLSITDEKGATPIISAAKNHNKELLTMLLQGMKYGGEPYNITERINIIEKILRQQKDREGKNAIDYATQYNIDLLKMLKDV